MANQDSNVEWRQVVGWEGFYEVSSEGAVRSVARVLPRKDGTSERRRSVVLKSWLHNRYALVHLRDTSAGRNKMALLHRVIALAFIPNPDGKPYINHIDCNPANNALSNLEWCTQAENLRHARDLGRIPSRKGKRSANASMSDADAQAIKSAYAAGGVSLQAVAERFGVSKRTVGRIVKGESYV